MTESRPNDAPLPSATGAAAVELTDAQRLAVLHEIHAEMRGSGGSTFIALGRYEDKIRARLGR